MANGLETERTRHLRHYSEKLYQESKYDLARWMWKHVEKVYEQALLLSEELNANGELAGAGALLHDVGDVWLNRFHQDFAAVTEQAIREALKANGFTADEAEIIIHEIIGPHGCREGNLPQTLEAKILATADGLAHLLTDFYTEAQQLGFPTNDFPGGFQNWVQQKLDRDFHTKIQFPEVRERARAQYEKRKQQFADLSKGDQ